MATKLMRHVRSVISATFLMPWIAYAAPVAAQSIEPLKGKTINLYIGFGPGGTYDLYARFLARHMGKHVPGNPHIVPQTMAGAGSITLANYLFNIAPKDGTAFGIVSGAIAVEEALKSSGIAYRAAEFNWIGRASNVTELLIGWHGAKAKTIEDVIRFETPAAGTGPASPSEGIPRLLNATMGTRFKIISGYSSSQLGLIAMEKGETDVAQTSLSTLLATKPDWVRDKRVNVLVQSTFARVLPEVPTVVETARTPEDKALLAFYTSSSEVGRAFLAPPGMEANRVTMLRQAFTATMQDPDYRAEVEKAKAELNWLPGDELQKLIADTVNVRPEIVARMREILGPQK